METAWAFKVRFKRSKSRHGPADHGADLWPGITACSDPESAEISHAALRMMTVYELERPIGTPRTHKRCRANLDEAMAQVEALVRRGMGIAAPASAQEVVNA